MTEMFSQKQPPPGPYLPVKTALYSAPCAFCGILDAALACEDCQKTLYCSLGCQQADVVTHRRHSCFRGANIPAQLRRPTYQPGQENPGQFIPFPNYPHSTDAGPSHGLHPDGEKQVIRNLLSQSTVEIPVSERQSDPVALKRTLMPHQSIGLTWLMKQEKSSLKGSILADGMGLGKTIQALALILSHPPQDSTYKTTLIVVPTALLRQWEREIDDKVKPGYKLKTIVFHGAKKRNMTITKLLSHDVVITTYGTIAHEWKRVYVYRRPEPPLLLSSDTMFHRIVLDEAHNIKNRKAQASQAMDHIHATYRLCMTGTPFMNRIAELFPLVRFLRIAPYMEWPEFKRRLIPKDTDSVTAPKEMNALLGRILLRRTETTIIDGQPVLNLPVLTVHTIEVEFDPDQREYYKALEQRSQIKVNKYIKEGTVNRNYWAIFLLVLRLRQCCCHPYLIKDRSIPEGVNATPGDMIKLARKLPKQVVDCMKLQEIFQCPMCHEDTKNPVIIHPCGHYACNNCITNLVCVRERGPETEGEGTDTSMGQCPTDGCTESVDLSKVICYEYFSEVHGPGELAEDDSEDDAGDAIKEEDPRGFVVSDDYEISDRGDDSNDNPRFSDVSGMKDEPRYAFSLSDATGNNSYSKPNATRQLHSMHSVPDMGSDDPADSNYLEGSEDSDNSLPPANSLFAGLKWKNEPPETATNTALTSLSDTRQNKRNNTGSSGIGNARAATNRNGDANQDVMEEGDSSISKDEKKRSARIGIAVPNKRAKITQGNEQRAGSTLDALKKPGVASATVRARYLGGLRKEWETSAKIDKAMELLGMIRQDFPNEKTLVFSQFTSFLDLIEIPVADNGYNYRRYDGSMSSDDREVVVDEFMKQPQVTVMLLSLTCGNVGLNLYEATRVIMLDPFWNPAVEDQAIKRAHRLGQTKPVFAYRIHVKNTVEDRILELQERKREMINNVLNSETREGASTMRATELTSLIHSQ